MDTNSVLTYLFESLDGNPASVTGVGGIALSFFLFTVVHNWACTLVDFPGFMSERDHDSWQNSKIFNLDVYFICCFM